MESSGDQGTQAQTGETALVTTRASGDVKDGLTTDALSALAAASGGLRNRSRHVDVCCGVEWVKVVWVVFGQRRKSVSQSCCKRRRS